MKEVAIVIPTYREAENLDVLVKRIVASVGNADFEIVVVDDNSPDNTWLIAVDMLSQDIFTGVVIRRINFRGLSSAILDGIHFSRSKYSLVMDADLQHPPEYITRFLEKIRENDVDMVIGSRFMEGGGIEGWSKIRLLISKVAALIAKLLLPEARKLSDPMSGFFMVRRDLVVSRRHILNPLGFKALLEILVKCRPRKVVEVPYVFKQRFRGSSKLGPKEIIAYLIHVLKLSRWRPLRFASVGALGTVVNLSTLGVLSLTIPELVTNLFIIGSAIAIEVSTIFNFFLHEYWTFSDRRGGPKLRRLLLFHLAVFPAIGVQYSVANILKYLLSIHPILAQFIGILLGFVVNYVLSELGVWTKRTEEL